ncbi:amidohydrolase [Aciduricibacillus chroicocephali]|uniref:Amidohydrolase n=1 Tax=Aciduricibacillus chroicocephali TaxID=3054939 RepID=A0ABY9KUS4_9BACI|nr:amidohydrolase [Bacillaceae bacterium 44XB]
MFNTQFADNELVDWAIGQRRHFHMYPELSGQEYETAARVKSLLEEFGIPLLDGFSAPNVIGYFKGTEGKRTIALRADMDALPIVEEGEDRPYLSTVPGVMHGCGHDGHTATLLAAAKWMSQNPELVKNNIILIFQSSEEASPSGAQQLMKEGVLDKADVIYGIHYMSNMPLGQVGFEEGYAMASSDDFDIIIEGKGGHGGNPHETIDPIYISTHLIQAFQSIVSRNLNPLKSGVISVGGIYGGDSYNVIPDKVTLKGTIRALTFEGAKTMIEKTEQLTKSICEGFGAKGHFTLIEGTPPLYNHPEACKTAEKIIRKTFGDDLFTPIEAVFGAEDFSYYLKEKTGAFVNIGMQGPKSQYPHHHPKFDLDEAAMPAGIELMIKFALEG